MTKEASMVLSEPLDISIHEHIAVLTLNDPKTRNALTGEAVFSCIESAVRNINADLNVRVAILTGNGPVFCSGGNTRDMRDRAGMFAGSPSDLEFRYRTGIQRIPRSLAQLEVPLLAAVNGPAIGAGLDLACMCDIRYASTSASFSESFVKLGIIAGDGGAWFLPRVVGYANAAQMAFTGETLNAEQALRIGLVTKMTPDANLMSEIMDLAEKIASNPPQVVRWTKRLMRDGLDRTLDSTLHSAAAFQALAHATQDHTEAMKAVFEGRKVRFLGK